MYALPMLFAVHSWIWQPSDAHHSWWNPFNGLNTGWASGAPAPTVTWFSVLSNSILWFVFVVVVGTIAKIMLQAAQLEGAEDRSPSFDNLWKTTREIGWRMVGLYIVVGLYIIVGLILFIIPGLILLRRYFLAPFVMLDKKPRSITEAMDISARMSKPHSSSIWSVIGVSLFFGLLSLVPIIGWLVSFLLGMFYSVAPALRYKELKNLN